MLKRIADIVIALVLIVAFTPIWLCFILLIKLTSPGPIFFRQERPGLKGKPFKIYKFRTMEVGSDKMVKGQEVQLDDPRITSIGYFLRRYKIDELVQLINVLRAEMSLVGPRPERMSSLDDYDDVIRRRLDVKPGMTGLAQVSGNIYIPLSNRYAYDVYYADNLSVWLDIRILFRTVGVVLFGERKYAGRPLVWLNSPHIKEQ